MIRAWRWCVIPVICLIVAQADAADPRGPDPRIKELAILDQLAGAWTGTQPGSKRKVKTTSQWVLSGRVLQTHSLLTDGREMLVLRTYDPGLRKFVVTIWDSRGMTLMLFGDYDPETRTLSATADVGSTHLSAVSRLTDPNTEEWQVQLTDASGKALRQFGGINRRDAP